MIKNDELPLPTGEERIESHDEKRPDYINTCRHDFDGTAFKLGTLCKRGHDHERTGMSVRYLMSGTCVLCTKVLYALNRDADRERRRVRYQRDRARVLDDRKIYQHANADKIKVRNRKRYEANRVNILAKRRVYYEENRAHKLSYAKTYRGSDVGIAHWKSNNAKRRASRAETGGSYTPHEWETTLTFFAYRCAYCGDEYRVRDHIVPISNGGSSNVCNIVPACRRCNSDKRARAMVEWYQAQPQFDKDRLNKIHAYMERFATALRE